MNVQSIVTRARRLGYVDSNQYQDSQAIEDFNIIYHDIENTIVDIQEDYFWDYFLTNTIVGQSEYLFPDLWDADYDSLYKNIALSIKYSSLDIDFSKASRVYPYQLDHDIEWYKTGQSRYKPFFYIADTSFFIYPVPTEEVSQGLKIYGIKNLSDLAITATADEIFANNIPKKFYHIISLGMLEFIYQSRGMINEAINARARYEKEKELLVGYITSRNTWVLQVEMPNLSNLY